MFIEMTNYATSDYCDHNQCVKRGNPELAGLNMASKVQHIHIRENSGGELIHERFLVGSVAEFSVDPLLSTIGDVDLATQYNNEIACFDELNEQTIETYNYCFHPWNELYEIVAYARFPGYVIVRQLGLLHVENNQRNLYILDMSAREKISATRYKQNLRSQFSNIGPVVKGPALKSYYNNMSKSSISNSSMNSQDYVRTIRCFAWPPAAMEWKTRQRKHGWPDERTIALVVESGCHVVPVAHNDNRVDEYQWRISFSKAEVILMNSLTPGQQYIYHMLRYFVKRKLLVEELENSEQIVSTYTIKTLILWQCETRPIRWFTKNNSYEICRCLLEILLNWLKVRYCKNYFITECNIFAFKMNENYFDKIVKTLIIYTDLHILSQWFESDFCQRCISHRIHQEKKGSYEVNQSALVGSKHHLYKFYLAENYLSFMVSRIGLSDYVKSTSPPPSNSFRGLCAKHIGLIDDFFVDFYKGHVILQAVTFEKTHKKHDNVLAMLSSLFVSQEFTIKISPFSCHSSVFHLVARQYYYKIANAVLSDKVSCTVGDRILKMKLATILMKKALSRTYDDPHFPHYMIRVYLAALYFRMQCYDKCSAYIDRVARRTSDFESAFDARDLCFIDDVVIAVGLLHLVNYNSVQLLDRRKEMNFTISIFFFYNWFRCLCQVMQHDVMIFNSLDLCIPKNINEFLLLVILKRKMNTYPKNVLVFKSDDEQRNINKENESDEIRVSETDSFQKIITKCGVIHISEFFQQLIETGDIGESKCIGTFSHYKALYWYKEGNIDIVLKLCKRILEEEKTSEYEGEVSKLVFMPSCIFPFQDLYDKDVTCITSLMFLMSPDLMELTKKPETIRYINNDSFRRRICIHIRPEFLARYLIARCTVDRYGITQELVLALRQLSGKLILEHMLIKFLVIKFHKIFRKSVA